MIRCATEHNWRTLPTGVIHGRDVPPPNVQEFIRIDMNLLGPLSAPPRAGPRQTLTWHAAIYAAVFALCPAAADPEAALASLFLAIGLVAASAVDMRRHVAFQK